MWTRLKNLLRRRGAEAAAITDRQMRRDQFNDEMRGGGWRLWEYEPPYSYDCIEAHRFEWGEPTTLEPVKVHPLMNVAGLWWRPVGPRVDVTPAPTDESAGGDDEFERMVAEQKAMCEMMKRATPAEYMAVFHAGRCGLYKEAHALLVDAMRARSDPK